MLAIKEILVSGIKELGIDVTDQQVVLFTKFMDLMLEWNKKINLTAITEPTEIVVKHFLDSLVPLIYGERYACDLSYSLDLGTGGGFPGIPLKIMYPEMNIILVDSLKKRINYLEEVIKKLALKKITALHMRAEVMGKDVEYREHFTTVFSRAVASLNILSEYCLPLVKPGGMFIALKGPTLAQEVKASKKAINLLGGRISAFEEIELPMLKDPRTLLFIKKEKPTPQKFPRKPGLPKKNPI